jgi:hypothetical protein
MSTDKNHRIVKSIQTNRTLKTVGILSQKHYATCVFAYDLGKKRRRNRTITRSKITGNLSFSLFTDMTTNREELTCGICKKLFTQPVVHRYCGISYDRDCLGQICPSPRCGRRIEAQDLIDNYTFLSVIDEYRVSLTCSYYLILLDTSSSMWYSDKLFLPFLRGESRFSIAIRFLVEFFTKKYKLCY